MLKLYFKKLFLILGVILMWIAICAAIAMVCGLANDIAINYTAYALCMIASGVVTAVLVGVAKARDYRRKTEYLTATGLQKVRFWREIGGILRSKPYIAELLAFATWLVPLMVCVCQFPEYAAVPIGGLIATSLLAIVEFTAMFALLDLIVSFIVRKLWMRGF